MGRKEFNHMMPSKNKIQTTRYSVVFAFSFFGDFLFWKSGASFSCVLLKWTLLRNWGFCSKKFSSFFHLLWFWGRGHFPTYSFTVNLVLICLNKGYWLKKYQHPSIGVYRLDNNVTECVYTYTRLWVIWVFFV